MLVAFWRGSRSSTQSVLGATSRCRHRSDGAESHAFGRALEHSSHLRLHPDHVRVRTLLLESGAAVISRPSCLRTPLELGVIDPHAVEDDGKFSGDGDDGPLVAT